MCGRFGRWSADDRLSQLFRAILREVPEPRYNVAPGMEVLAACRSPAAGARELVGLRWGVIPSWAKDRKMGYRLINARAETVAEKPSFRAAFKQRRCLVAADAFYEWRQTPQGKQPYLIRLRGGEPFALAGLWETWHDKATGERVEFCTIIVGAANDLVRPIHDRMPVIVPPADFDAWLDPAVRDRAVLLPLLKPYHPDEMEAYAISSRVNKPANEGPELIEAV